MVGWGMSPSEFWRLHPTEFFWQAEAHKARLDAQKKAKGTITEDEATEMLDDLRRLRASMGLPPE